VCVCVIHLAEQALELEAAAAQHLARHMQLSHGALERSQVPAGARQAQARLCIMSTQQAMRPPIPSMQGTGVAACAAHAPRCAPSAREAWPAASRFDCCTGVRFCCWSDTVELKTASGGPNGVWVGLCHPVKGVRMMMPAAGLPTTQNI